MRTDNPVFLQKYTELAKEDRDRYKRETRGEFTHAPRISTPAHPLPPLVACLRYLPIKTTAAQRQEARDMMKATGNTRSRKHVVFMQPDWIYKDGVRKWDRTGCYLLLCITISLCSALLSRREWQWWWGIEAGVHLCEKEQKSKQRHRETEEREEQSS